TAASLTTTGAINAVSLGTSGAITATGQITGGSLQTSGAINAASLNTSGAIIAQGAITCGGQLSANSSLVVAAGKTLLALGPVVASSTISMGAVRPGVRLEPVAQQHII